MNDAAFVAMDLDAAGRSDLSTLFINSYTEWTGDWVGLQILPLYTCMRAYVRAMVHSLASAEPQAPPEEKEQAQRAARRYYQLAWQYTQQKTGQLILIGGVSGSGKSTLASTLAQKLRAIHIRSDAVRKHLAGVPLDQYGDQNIYSPGMKTKTYARLLELGLLLAGRGFRVILDAKYDRRSLRRQAIDSAQRANLPLQLIQCTAPEPVLRTRLSRRQNDVSDATADLLANQLQEFEPLDEQELKIGRIIDTTQPLDPAEIA
jgi:predicted kinase